MIIKDRLAIVLIKADARYFCSMRFEPVGTLARTQDWLKGMDDPEIEAKIIRWMESDIRWTQQIQAEVARYYWYLWPVVWFVSRHIQGCFRRQLKILKANRLT